MPKALQESGFDPMAHLERATQRLDGLEQRLAHVTGAGASDDGLVEAVVGAYGDLRDLVIDPRVFRDTDSVALADAVLAAATAAKQEATEEVTRISQEAFGSWDPDLASGWTAR